MNSFWNYFWPLFALGLLLGGIMGLVAFRRRRRSLVAVGVVLCLAGTALWHWPLAAADRFVAKVESTAQFVLADWEMNQVQAHLHRGPLSRRLVLSGPADEFQRSELVRMMSTIPGVSTATWSASAAWPPLLLEASGVVLLGFLLGLLLAYVVELRRRYNAQWKW